MATLSTVADYVAAARILLQDKVIPYRYPDADLVLALNLAMLDARRIRADLFVGRSDDVPAYSESDTAEAVTFDQQYRGAVLYYIVGHAQLRDEEDTQDQRAAGFLAKFTAQMLSVQG